MGGSSAEQIQRAVEKAQQAGVISPENQLYVDGDEIVAYPEVLNRDPERITQVPQGQRWAHK